MSTLVHDDPLTDPKTPTGLDPWPFVRCGTLQRVMRAEGAYLYMQDGSKNGRKVLDAGGGAIIVNIGHGRQEVAQAIYDAILNCTYALPPWLTPEREALMEELQQHWLPKDLHRVHFTTGGSDANEAAIKMAVQYHAARGKPKKHQIIARNLSYHGATITTAAVSGHAIRKRGLEPIMNAYPTIETPYPLRCPLGAHHPDATDYYIENLEQTIAKVGADNIAALIAEPISGSSGGGITPPPGYWPRAQQLLWDNDILLIMDEVMTGFGRTGEKFCYTHYGIKPDLLVGGKGLAGGYAAIGGVYGGDVIAETITNSPYDVMFHTLAALPQSCAAATKVLQIIREEQMLSNVKKVGKQLLGRLDDALGQDPHVAEIRGEGLLIGIEVVRDRETLEPFPEEDNMTSKIVNYALGKGVFFYSGGTGDVRDIICIGAPFMIGDAEIDLMVTTLKTAIAESTKQ